MMKLHLASHTIGNKQHMHTCSYHGSVLLAVGQQRGVLLLLLLHVEGLDERVGLQPSGDRAEPGILHLLTNRTQRRAHTRD
jgi:hypothetical protein